MILNEQLNTLFQKWETRVDGYQNSFKKDGVIDEDLYSEAKPKILFITKEPNDPEQKAGDYREWWKEGLKYSFSLRITEWAYGIFNQFPPYDIIKGDVPKLNRSIQSIAFLNIKKIGGKGTSKEKDILSHLEQCNDLIHKEIDIINPDIIITGITWKSVRKELFQNIEWKESGYSIAISKFNNSKVVDFYHPSSRTAPSASYSLLQNVIESKAFRNL